MPSPTKAVKLRMGGSMRQLRFDNAALIAIEDEAGLTVTELGAALQRGSLKTVAVLLWAGRLHAEPELKLAEVINEIDLRKLQDVAQAVEQAMVAAFGEMAEEPTEGNPQATG